MSARTAYWRRRLDAALESIPSDRRLIALAEAVERLELAATGITTPAPPLPAQDGKRALAAAIRLIQSQKNHRKS